MACSSRQYNVHYDWLIVGHYFPVMPTGRLQQKAIYSQSSRKRPPRDFEKVVVTRAGRLQEYALVSDPMVKQ